MIETSTIAELTRRRSKPSKPCREWNTEKKPKTFVLVKLKTDDGLIVDGWWTGGKWDGAWGNKHYTIEAWSTYKERQYP